jgi:hypothetical protein
MDNFSLEDASDMFCRGVSSFGPYLGSCFGILGVKLGKVSKCTLLEGLRK